MSFGRAWRRWRRLWQRGHDPVALIWDERFAHEMPGVPHHALRGALALAWAVEEQLVDIGRIQSPRPASLEALERVHGKLARLELPEVVARALGVKPSQGETDHLLRLQRLICGGTTLAVFLASNAQGRVWSMCGGLHHARADRVGGFCLVNDIGVAIRSWRAHGHQGPVLVIDLDLHHGDGTEQIFADDPSVWTYSVHNRDWRQEAAVANTRIALGADVDDATYLASLEASLPGLIQSHQPELVIYLAGRDVAADDALGNWHITADALLARDRMVLQWLGKRATVVLPAGGYGSGAWRHDARALAALTGVALEPPDTEAMTLRYYQHRIRQQLQPTRSASAADDTWMPTIDASDLDPALAGSPTRPTRFLGLFSPHQIEIALEHAGLLARLRDLGFRALRVGLGGGQPGALGETVRLTSDAPDAELLAELRVYRDRSTFEKAELLHIEWLLLQNPRAPFAAGRPRMPGQQHPGLGMLRDVIALLAAGAEHLGMDGLGFTPSHYHLAAAFSRALRFANPADAQRFDALRRALAELPLAEATERLAAGAVIDTASGAVIRWRPAPMVLPVTARLIDRIAARDAAYEAPRPRYRLSSALA